MLYIKDTSMLVAGVAVPGLVKKLEITGAAVIDAVTDDNNVTLGYQPNGYEPLKMNVDLLLEPSAGESVEGMVQTIQLLFKPPGQTAAIPLPVVNSQAAACGLNLVYFKGIDLSKKTETVMGRQRWNSGSACRSPCRPRRREAGKTHPPAARQGRHRPRESVPATRNT